jgi:2-hydroxycyclohexanecarboxyl-CoA dehydrogenase
LKKESRILIDSGGEKMLEGKKAFVTGGAMGIGRGIVEFFIKNGATVSIMDLNEEMGLKASKETGCFFFKGDVSSLEDVKRAVDGAIEKMGYIDVLVNNAGWDTVKLFIETTPELWRKIIDINYIGVLNTCYVIIPHMKERKSGAIVNISSDAGRVGSTGEAVYSGTKGAVIAFSKAIAREHARDNIRVNVVCPGPTETPLLDEIKKSPLGEKIITSMDKFIPLRRLGKPEDIAPIVGFLASDFSSYITGQVISVSGGLNMVG